MTEPDRAPDLVAPLDAGDPRFAGSEEAREHPHHRALVESRGPGGLQDNPRVRVLRVAIPLAFAGGLAAVVAVFAIGLDPGSGSEVVGPVALVRAAVAERPRRFCYHGEQPCAWLTVVDGELLALNTNGPLPEEFGRLGVAWCASSGGFGSNVSGSRFDARGNVVRGPAPRGLDRYRLTLGPAGRLTIDFSSLTTGLQVAQVPGLIPPAGPLCDQIPFDREADLPTLERA